MIDEAQRGRDAPSSPAHLALDEPRPNGLRGHQPGRDHGVQVGHRLLQPVEAGQIPGGPLGSGDGDAARSPDQVRLGQFGAPDLDAAQATEPILGRHDHLDRIPGRRQLDAVQPGCGPAADCGARRDHELGGVTPQSVGERDVGVGVGVAMDLSPGGGPELFRGDGSAGMRAGAAEHAVRQLGRPMWASWHDEDGGASVAEQSRTCPQADLHPQARCAVRKTDLRD